MNDAHSTTHAPVSPDAQKVDGRHLSESEYLQKQAERAQALIAETLQRLQADLKDTADVNAWARKYPWPSVGAAAALGFLAAAAITPNKEDRQRKKWSTFLNEVIAESQAQNVPPPPGDASQASASPLSSVFKGLLGTLATAIQTSVVSAVTAKAQTQEPSTNGHEPVANHN